MRNFILGVSVGYVFHNAIQNFVSGFTNTMADYNDTSKTESPTSETDQGIS